MKNCSDCNELKPLIEFHKHKRMKDGHVSVCKPCRSQKRRLPCMSCGERNKSFGSGNKYCDGCRESAMAETIRRKSAVRRRLWLYGLNEEDMSFLVSSQGGRCANFVCSNVITVRTAQVDHNHLCCPTNNIPTCGNCIRGLLCNKCNLGLGAFMDSPELLNSAANYLVLYALEN